LLCCSDISINFSRFIQLPGLCYENKQTNLSVTPVRTTAQRTNQIAPFSSGTVCHIIFNKIENVFRVYIAWYNHEGKFGRSRELLCKTGPQEFGKKFANLMQIWNTKFSLHTLDKFRPIKMFNRCVWLLCKIYEKFDKKRRKEHLQKAQKWLCYSIGIKYNHTRTYHL
jgi:hypothetical protein